MAEHAAVQTAASVLLVDDDASLLRLISLRLASGGFAVDAVESAEIALGRLATQRPDVVVTDLRMTGMDGMALFRQIREMCPGLPVIILTAHGSISEAVTATEQGVFAFLTKPFDSRELLEVVQSAAGMNPQSDQPSKQRWREGLLTRSRAMHNVLDEVALIAPSDATVLILGESGTGKEMIARAIHQASQRARGTFIPLNCAALPADLLEAELFGYTKGAFTGADTDRDGLFVQAAGGTLLLDEIGDMPMAFQAKLLRAVQEKAVRPVGSSREIPVDVRLLSATHQDLDHALSVGAMREDLYYRLNVVRVELPALRDRPEDIPLLAAHFLTEFQQAQRRSPAIRRFSAEAMRQLVGYRWPGNVRQLRRHVRPRCA
ncbi:MAG: sigma-54 dependent transcriptional regulator, partial [Pseudomonadota bacterium]